MLPLSMLGEKQQKLKKRDKSLLMFTKISCILFLISSLINLYVVEGIYVLVSLSIVFLVLLIFYWINLVRLGNNTKHIAKKIELILCSSIVYSKHCIDVDVTFINNSNSNDDFLHFGVEAYGKNVKYDDLALLASILDPVIKSINDDIQQKIVVYYRISNTPFNT